MAIKLINQYQASRDSIVNRGFFYFTYFNGEQKCTGPVGAESFKIVNCILRNENPEYGDQTKAMVTTQSEEVGEEGT